MINIIVIYCKIKEHYQRMSRDVLICWHLDLFHHVVSGAVLASIIFHPRFVPTPAYIARLGQPAGLRLSRVNSILRIRSARRWKSKVARMEWNVIRGHWWIQDAFPGFRYAASGLGHYESLVHDALYQFIKADSPLNRKQADEAFLRLMVETEFFFRRIYWLAVRAIGWLVWKVKSRKRHWHGQGVTVDSLTTIVE